MKRSLLLGLFTLATLFTGYTVVARGDTKAVAADAACPGCSCCTDCATCCPAGTCTTGCCNPGCCR